MYFSDHVIVYSWLYRIEGLKTLFNIVEERFKKLLNFDVSAI